MYNKQVKFKIKFLLLYLLMRVYTKVRDLIICYWFGWLYIADFFFCINKTIKSKTIRSKKFNYSKTSIIRIQKQNEISIYENFKLIYLKILTYWEILIYQISCDV